MKYSLIKMQDGEIKILPNALERYRELNRIKMQAEILEQEIKQELKLAMEQYGIDFIKTDYFKASLVKETTERRFNSTKFKKDHPSLYEEYRTERKKKGYVKVSFDD